jgi:hypothetical protein
MKRLFLITLLLLSSGPTYAEWVEIRETDYGMTVYADPHIIHSKVNLVKMWELYDYKTIQTIAGDSFLSSKSQHEYDCAEELDRLIAFIRLSGNMGSGTVVFSNSDEQQWEPVQPNSIGETLWTFACAKK